MRSYNCDPEGSPRLSNARAFCERTHSSARSLSTSSSHACSPSFSAHAAARAGRPDATTEAHRDHPRPSSRLRRTRAGTAEYVIPSRMPIMVEVVHGLACVCGVNCLFLFV